MVVMGLFSTSPARVMHDLTACQSTCTVQAPHRPVPHPCFVPLRPRWSRITSSSVASRSSGGSGWRALFTSSMRRVLREPEKPTDRTEDPERSAYNGLNGLDGLNGGRSDS